MQIKSSQREESIERLECENQKNRPQHEDKKLHKCVFIAQIVMKNDEYDWVNNFNLHEEKNCIIKRSLQKPKKIIVQKW